MRRFRDQPLLVLLMGIGALAMLVPAIHGLSTRDYPSARAFFYSAIVFLVLFLMTALATSGWRAHVRGRSELISILAAFTVLPAMLAVPFAEAVPNTRFYNAYFEMVSSLTTTGMTMFEPARLPDSVHLWRALVGWLGGFLVWVTAFAVMAPLNLGGFEVWSQAEIGQAARQTDAASPAIRLRRVVFRLLPVYGGLTLVLWIALYIAGDTAFVAACHAMATLSTSGISPVDGLAEARSGQAGELVIFLFFIFALSRLTFSRPDREDGLPSILRDPELRLGVMIAFGLAALLFLRHWAASLDAAEMTFTEGLRGLWGSLFTVASFLTTTGFASQDWDSAQAWSGFGSPSVMLLGLAVFGGGVATTAGGVKLLRVYALYKHGLREMEKLVQPSSIGSGGRHGRRFRRQGAYAAWVFFMLFAVSIAAVMLALSLVGGLDFEASTILTIASLSTTGPLTELAGDAPLELARLGDVALAILCASMVLGRLETLVIIALLNPDFWR